MGPYSDTDMTTFSKYRSISSIVIMIKGDGYYYFIIIII